MRLQRYRKPGFESVRHLEGWTLFCSCWEALVGFEAGVPCKALGPGGGGGEKRRVRRRRGEESKVQPESEEKLRPEPRRWGRV